MIKSLVTGVVFGIALFVVMMDELRRQKRLGRYWHRSCMGKEWQRVFPDVDKDDIRRFLNIFGDAFMFRKRHRLKFRPTDKVMDVYRTVYTTSSSVDAMELERFTEMLEREYGVDFGEGWWSEETTLAEIFELTRRRKQDVERMA